MSDREFLEEYKDILIKDLEKINREASLLNLKLAATIMRIEDLDKQEKNNE